MKHPYPHWSNVRLDDPGGEVKILLVMQQGVRDDGQPAFKLSLMTADDTQVLYESSPHLARKRLRDHGDYLTHQGYNATVADLTT